MFCPKCGTQNADGARFCLKCGASLAPDAVKTEPAAPDEKTLLVAVVEESKWPKAFWIIAAAGVVIGLLSSLILFLTQLITNVYNVVIYGFEYDFGTGLSAAFKAVFSVNRIFTGLFLIAAVVLFFIPATKKYPYVVAIPWVILGLITVISSIYALIADIGAITYLRQHINAFGLAIVFDILWILAGLLFFLDGLASLLAIFLKDKLKGKGKLALIILGGVAILTILLGLLASLLAIIYGILNSFASTVYQISDILFHAALICPMVAGLYVYANINQPGMELKDLKDLFKKEEKAAENE